MDNIQLKTDKEQLKNERWTMNKIITNGKWVIDNGQKQQTMTNQNRNGQGTMILTKKMISNFPASNYEGH